MKLKKEKYCGFTRTQIHRTCDEKGKSLEEQLREAVANKTPIDGASPEIYTPLSDGVLPQYDVRTDRQEIALDALTKVDKTHILHRDEMSETETPNVEPLNKEQNANT